jgi:hypothetical protein
VSPNANKEGIIFSQLVQYKALLAAGRSRKLGGERDEIRRNERCAIRCTTNLITLHQAGVFQVIINRGKKL